MRFLSLMAVLACGVATQAQAPVTLKMSDFPPEKQKELKALGFGDSWTLTVNPPAASTAAVNTIPQPVPQRIAPQRQPILPYTPLPNLQQWIGGGGVQQGIGGCQGGNCYRGR